MGVASAGFHLLGALRRAIGRVFLNFLIFLVIGFVIMEGLLWYTAGTPALSGYRPGLFVHIASVLLGLALGYAAALTVIVREALHFMIHAVQDVEKDVQGELSGAGHVLQAVEQAVRGKR